MEVEEICRKLKPLLGSRADQYLQAYLAEDYKGKAELKTALELMSSHVLSKDLERPSLTLSAPPVQVARGPYPLGTVVYAWRPLYSFGLREEEWIQHVAIFGRSGAGKTNAIVVLVRDLMAKGKVKTKPMITHRFPFDDAVQAFQLLVEDRSKAVGVVLQY